MYRTKTVRKLETVIPAKKARTEKTSIEDMPLTGTEDAKVHDKTPTNEAETKEPGQPDKPKKKFKTPSKESIESLLTEKLIEYEGVQAPKKAEEEKPEDAKIPVASLQNVAPTAILINT